MATVLVRAGVMVAEIFDPCYPIVMMEMSDGWRRRWENKLTSKEGRAVLFCLDLAEETIATSSTQTVSLTKRKA